MSTGSWSHGGHCGGRGGGEDLMPLNRHLFFKVLKIQVSELCWPFFLNTCALSAAIEAAFQLRRHKSWFRSRLIAFSEML
jgi:hypothetical protein